VTFCFVQLLRRVPPDIPKGNDVKTDDADKTVGEAVESRRRARRRGIAVLAFLLAAAVGLAACSGSSAPGLAGVGATTTTQPIVGGSGSGDPSSELLKFSQCMRSHGVTDFPDPGSGGLAIQANGSNSDLDPNSPTFQAAERACRKYVAAGIPTGAELAQDMTDLLHYAQCMRSHGVTNFPDPEINPQGGPGFVFTPNIDQSSPTFQAADRACHSLLPGGGEGHGP
jgi:hypothetical protein